MTDTNQKEYRLSRIYAEGWNAARTGAGQTRSLPNPYRNEPERTRWNEGYANARD